MTMALPPHWIDVSGDPDRQNRLAEELRMECGPGHLLASRTYTGMAECGSCDSALFQLDLGEWAVVHLTYSGEQDWNPEFPWVEAIGSWEDVLPELEDHSSESDD
ncbi:MAG TPA: hypothetical protein VFH69_01625 [Gemmatimonadota bacterium]|nr:hypothetical protein [Gemmatimonadota bacterium]